MVTLIAARKQRELRAGAQLALPVDVCTRVCVHVCVQVHVLCARVETRRGCPPSLSHTVFEAGSLSFSLSPHLI